jgi:DNA-directed RNA polymerase specialized sigma24 family protein
VIEQLVKNKIYIQITRNVCHNHELCKDLHNEAILVILEKNFDLSEIRNLQHFFSAIVWRTWHSNKFKKKYLQNNFEFIDNMNGIVDEKFTIDYSTFEEFLNKDTKDEHEFYEQNLLKLYIHFGDAKKLSDKTKIPYRTVANDIKAIKEKLKKTHNEKNSY